MKPILFNTEMVKAILEGRKTVTRRVMKPQPDGRPVPMTKDSCYPGYFAIQGTEKVVRPPFQPGDILWVRETFRVDYLSNIPGSGRVQYKDDAYMDISFDAKRYNMMRRAQRKPGWRPNENMPPRGRSDLPAGNLREGGAFTGHGSGRRTHGGNYGGGYLRENLGPVASDLGQHN